MIANEDGTGAKVKLKAVRQSTADSAKPDTTLADDETTPTCIETTPTRSLTSQYISQLRNEGSPSVLSPRSKFIASHTLTHLIPSQLYPTLC